MIEWKVAEEGEAALPLPEPDVQPRPGPLVGRRALLLTLALAVGLALALGWQARVREAQLRADLAARLAEEARAQSFGQSEQTSRLADPAAPAAWRERYAALFVGSPALPAAPTLTTLRWQGERVTVEVAWPTSPAGVTEPRAYRLVGGTWRRSPLPLEPPAPVQEHASSYFSLRGQPDDLAALTDDPDLRLSLEGLRARIITYWPEGWDRYFLTLHVVPQELSPPVYFRDAQKLYVNRPALSLVDPASPLPRKAQFRLAVTTAVVEWLTTPEWLRDPQTGNASAPPPPEFAGRVEWLRLLRLLQQAEGRRWALDGAQRRALRDGWRTELGEAWPAALLDPAAAPEEPRAARQQELALTLMIEQLIERGGVGTAGRLAHTLQGYPPDGFSALAFFQALVGGSSRDVEQLFRTYVLTPETRSE